MRQSFKQENVFRTSIAAKPIDMERISAQLLLQTKWAARKALEKRAQMDAAGLQDKPLTVFGLECHTDVFNRVAHMLILDRFKQAGQDIQVGYEYEHAYLNKNFSKYTGERSHSESYNHQLQKADQAAGGKYSLSCLFRKDFKYTPYTMHMLSHYMMQNEIPFSLVDAKRITTGIEPYEKVFVDLKDPETLMRAKKYITDQTIIEKNRVDFGSALGMKIRNDLMADKIGEMNGRIRYIVTGARHGLRMQDMEDVTSVPLLLKQRGEDVYVINGVGQDKSLSIEKGLDKEEVVNLSSGVSIGAVKGRLYKRVCGVQIGTQKKEQKLLRMFFNQAGLQHLSDCAPSVRSMKEIRKAQIKSVDEFFSAVVEAVDQASGLSIA